MRGTNLNLAFGLEIIYDDAEFNISENSKVGIVGVNGSGKTTLFKVLLKEQELDSGNIYLMPTEQILKSSWYAITKYNTCKNQRTEKRRTESSVDSVELQT